MISRRWAPEVRPVEAGGSPGRGGVGSGVWSWVGSRVCALRWLGGGAPEPLYLQRVGIFFAVPSGQERHLGMWFWQSIAGCLSITAFTDLCPGNSTHTSSLPRPQPEVSWSDIAFPPLRHAKTLLRPFWPCSRPRTCRTVPAVHDLLSLPA